MLPLCLLLVCATGCGFCLFESEIIIEPVPMPQVAKEEPVQPQGWTEVAAATIRWLTGETEIRREAIKAAEKAGVPVRHITRRRFFRIER